MRFKSMSADHFLEEGMTLGRQEGISIGEQRARRSIMARLLATGMTPAQAAAITGMDV